MPWNRLGRTPLDHWRAEIGCCPDLPADVSTMKPGSSSVADPRP
jgi:hypothetical protein